jgi:hypothetical protein
MAGRKLTDAEKESYNKRMAATRESKNKEAAAKAGIDKTKIKTRTPAEIDAAIAKAKADPKFQAREAKLKTAMEAKGTQIDHHITGVKNFSKAIGEGLSSGGILGVAIHATAAYNQELKRQAKEKSDLAKKVY